MDKNSSYRYSYSFENFIDTVCIITTFLILSFVFWGNHSVSDFYQNILLTFPYMIISIIHNLEIFGDDKYYLLNRHFSKRVQAYKISFFIAILVWIATIILLISGVNENLEVISQHIKSNKFWGFCIIPYMGIAYILCWNYLIPMIADIRGDASINKKIKFEERNP